MRKKYVTLQDSFLSILNESNLISFDGLSEEEIDITVSIYGYRQRWSKLDELKDKYNYSRSSLYEIANASLEHMARRIFGDA